MNISSTELFSEIDLHMLHKSIKQIRIYTLDMVLKYIESKYIKYKTILQNYKKKGKKRRTTNKMKEQDEDEGVR